MSAGQGMASWLTGVKMFRNELINFYQFNNFIGRGTSTTLKERGKYKFYI
jgi:hypothetical protein